MRTLAEHIDDLDRMVDNGSAPKHEIRSQIAFIGREVTALQEEHDRLKAAYSQAQLEHSKAQPESSALPDNAKRLLLEIELCDVSTPKGLSILRVTETEGDYLPHLYNAKPPSQIRAIDLNEVIQATDDLVEAGWLKFHAVEEKVTEYRRTSLSIPF
ncbi:MAG: hypothetical protein KIS67_11585 [Verrucomicrobiae bacterium]|nr:hypothetical protein [Verrucomicrobiae bacterium]